MIKLEKKNVMCHFMFIVNWFLGIWVGLGWGAFTDPFTIFSTSDWDQVADIRQNGQKKRFEISKDVKFKRDLLKANSFNSYISFAKSPNFIDFFANVCQISWLCGAKSSPPFKLGKLPKFTASSYEPGWPGWLGYRDEFCLGFIWEISARFPRWEKVKDPGYEFWRQI